MFHACQEAIEEIQTLIRRITGYVSATRYLTTADHGFIYKRDKLQESDKISMDKEQISVINKKRVEHHRYKFEIDIADML